MRAQQVDIGSLANLMVTMMVMSMGMGMVGSGTLAQRAKIYILKVSAERIRDTADMLRYDDCFEVEWQADGSIKAKTLHFTPDRWRSFGYLPEVVLTYNITAKEEDVWRTRASGFSEGIRFAQKVLGGHLIEG